MLMIELEKKNLCGAKIRQLREAAGMSLPEFAEFLKTDGVLDFHKNILQRIETGNRPVSDFEIIAIANAFGVAPRELLDFSEKEYKSATTLERRHA